MTQNWLIWEQIKNSFKGIDERIVKKNFFWTIKMSFSIKFGKELLKIEWKFDDNCFVLINIGKASNEKAFRVKKSFDQKGAQ